MSADIDVTTNIAFWAYTGGCAHHQQQGNGGSITDPSVHLLAPCEHRPRDHGSVIVVGTHGPKNGPKPVRRTFGAKDVLRGR